MVAPSPLNAPLLSPLCNNNWNQLGTFGVRRVGVKQDKRELMSYGNDVAVKSTTQPLLSPFPPCHVFSWDDMTGSQEWKIRLKGQAYKGKFPQRSAALNSANSKLGCVCCHACFSWQTECSQ